MIGAVAKRYARALAGVAGEQGRLEETADELVRVGGWLDDGALEAALASPMLGAAERRALLAQMTDSLGLSDLTKDFLALLADKGRLGAFRSIVQAYERLVDRALGRIRATVRVAAPLPQASLAELVSLLEGVSGKRVLPSVEVDPELIAGITVEVEGRVFDGSARTQLAHLARTLAREGASA